MCIHYTAVAAAEMRKSVAVRKNNEETNIEITSVISELVGVPEISKTMKKTARRLYKVRTHH